MENKKIWIRDKSNAEAFFTYKNSKKEISKLITNFKAKVYLMN